jgi:RNA polymerase sigma-70 factor, ECF subfamily
LKSLDFAKIVLEHGNRVYNVVYCILGNTADAEDVSQEVFLRAFQALSEFEEKSAVSTWLHRIAVNAASDHIRKNKRSAFACCPLVEEQLEQLGRALDADDNPAARYEQKELNAAIQNALLRLPLKMRTVFVLKEIEGYSYKDIGEIADVPIKTVESRLFRARKMLRRELSSRAGKTGVALETM